MIEIGPFATNYIKTTLVPLLTYSHTHLSPIATRIDLVRHPSIITVMHPSSNTWSNSQGEHIPLEKTISIETVDDDKQSTISRDVPRAEHALEALQLVAGNRVRHARCAPEFLEEIAGAHFKKFTSKKFKVIAGSEARSFFKNYIMCVNSPFEISYP